MVCDRLYQLTFAFRKAKLWKKLSDMEIFAVESENGERYFAAVQGKMEEGIGLYIYPDQKAFESYIRMMALPPETHEVELFEALSGVGNLAVVMCGRGEASEEALHAAEEYAARAGVSLKGQNSIPNFSVQHPFEEVELPNDSEQEILCLVLEAAAEIARQMKDKEPGNLGFAPLELHLGEKVMSDETTIPLLVKSGEDFRWDSITLPEICEKTYEPIPFADDALCETVKSAETKEPAMMGLLHAPIYSADETGHYLPLCLITVFPKAGQIMISAPKNDRTLDADAMLREVVQDMKGLGIFADSIAAYDCATEALLTGFAERCEIPLTKLYEDAEGKAEFLDAVSEAFIELMKKYDHEDEDECDCGHDHHHHHDDDCDCGHEHHHHHHGDDCDCGHDHDHVSDEEFEAILEMVAAMDDTELRTMPKELSEMLLDMANDGALKPEFAARVKRLFK